MRRLFARGIGHRRRFLQAIAKLRDDGAPPPPATRFPSLMRRITSAASNAQTSGRSPEEALMQQRI
jgi:hypothetical protein